MKTIDVLVLVVGVFGCANATCVRQGISAKGVFENIINSTLESVKNNLPDPIVIDGVDLDFNNGTLLHGGANVTDLRVSGIHTLLATAIKVDALRLRLDMTLVLSELIITTKYWGDLLLLELVPLYGSGRATFTLDQVSLQISGAAQLSGGISIKDTEVTLSLGDAVIDLHGLLNNEEFSALVSQMLNDNVADFVNDNQKLISSVISSTVEGVINAVLGGGSSKTYDEYLEEYIYC